MKKTLLFLLLLVPFFASAQNPVINSAPQKWLKWGRFSGSLYSDSAMLATDSSLRVPNTKWVKQNFNALGSYVTLGTTQTITGIKTFIANNEFRNIRANAVSQYDIGTSGVMFRAIYVGGVNAGTNSALDLTGLGSLGITFRGNGSPTYSRMMGNTGNWSFGGTTASTYKVDIRAAGTGGYFNAGNFNIDTSGNPILNATSTSGYVWTASGTSGIGAWAAPNSGTVTSITPGFGFTSSTPITTSGTLTVDTASSVRSFLNSFSKAQTDARFLKLSGGTLTGPVIFSNSVDFNASIGLNNQVGVFGSSPFSFAYTRSGLLSLLNSAGTFKTNLAWPNVSADQTINFPNTGGVGGTIALTSNIPDSTTFVPKAWPSGVYTISGNRRATGQWTFSNNIVMTANNPIVFNSFTGGYTGALTVSNLTADRTYSLPDRNGGNIALVDNETFTGTTNFTGQIRSAVNLDGVSLAGYYNSNASGKTLIGNNRSASFGETNIITAVGTGPFAIGGITFSQVSTAGVETDLLSINGGTKDATFAGSLTTSAPSGDTAQPWKLGSASTAVTTPSTTIIAVEVGGVTYYLPTVTP